MQASNIDEVISFLDQIIAENTARKSKLAYFTILYRKVTVAVKEAIEKKEFEDNPRMELLDVTFANRYLKAYSEFEQGEQPSACWLVAFQAADWYWPIVLQQLLLGINAHINLDLGIAAAEVAPGNDIITLKKDFEKINEILGSMIEGVQSDINNISPVIGLLDLIAGSFDERLADFSIKIARDGAWLFAEEYALANDTEKQQLFKKRDASIAWLGRDLRKPGFVFGLFAKFIRLFETSSVTEVIKVLKS
jgi:hypothetical protein